MEHKILVFDNHWVIRDCVHAFEKLGHRVKYLKFEILDNGTTEMKINPMEIKDFLECIDRVNALQNKAEVEMVVHYERSTRCH